MEYSEYSDSVAGSRLQRFYRRTAYFKYLFTTQPGMSINNLAGLEKLKVGVVKPQTNIEAFPKVFQGKIWTLAKFVAMVKEQQASSPKCFMHMLST